MNPLLVGAWQAYRTMGNWKSVGKQKCTRTSVLNWDRDGVKLKPERSYECICVYTYIDINGFNHFYMMNWRMEGERVKGENKVKKRWKKGERWNTGEKKVKKRWNAGERWKTVETKVKKRWNEGDTWVKYFFTLFSPPVTRVGETFI